MKTDAFGARSTFDTGHGPATLYRLGALADAGIAPGLDRLPFSIKVLLESVLRNVDGEMVTDEDVRSLAAWNAREPGARRAAVHARAGDPAGLHRGAGGGGPGVAASGGGPSRPGPEEDQPAGAGGPGGRPLGAGGRLRHSRRCRRGTPRSSSSATGSATSSCAGDRRPSTTSGSCPPPPGSCTRSTSSTWPRACCSGRARTGTVALPDTLVGTDSHTTMINGLGVLGWGVGGIEAEAGMLGQPLYMVTPQVVGFRLVGRLREGTTATDLVLTVVQMLRKKGVVEKFVEYFGPGLSEMSLADRATIANMAPEYGATCGFFPVDDTTLSYLRRTGRSDGRGGPGGALLQGAGSVPHRRDTGPGVHRHPGAGPGHRRAEPGRSQAAPGPGGPVADEGVVPHEPDRAGAGPGLRADRRRGRALGSGGGAGTEGRAHARLGGHRRDHQLHQHLQPLGHAGRGAPGPQGAGSGASRCRPT